MGTRLYVYTYLISLLVTAAEGRRVGMEAGTGPSGESGQQGLRLC